MSDIKLTFRNESDDANNSTVVFFQKNVAVDIDDIAVAWTVIKNCGQGDFHPFVYTTHMQVCAMDSWGNYTSLLPASPGQCFHVYQDDSGDVLRYKGKSANPTEIQVDNDLERGSIHAAIFNSSRRMALKTNVVPEQKALFEFKPILFAGVIAEVDEGQVLDSAIVTKNNTELNLLGIQSADIVMTGGGRGTEAIPYRFELVNKTLL